MDRTRNRLLQDDRVCIIGLQVLTILLYLPVFSSNYLYTDEAVQLWHYRSDAAFHMFIEQGRAVTDGLMSFLFSKADTVSDLQYIRIFSLLGWLVFIPAWFLMIKQVLKREGFDPSLAFLIVIALVCSPTVTISIGWASCFELFLAYSAGLASGYFYYLYLMQPDGQPRKKKWFPFLSIGCGLLALFTYQNGIGCFLLPFFIHALANAGRYRKPLQSLLFLGLISLIYFLLFRYQLKSLGILASNRTDAGFHPINKLRFFFTKPFVSSLLAGFGYDETNRRMVLPAIPVLLALLYGSYRLFSSGKGRLFQVLFLVLLCMASYFPSLIVRENYASSRTTLALAIIVFTWIILILSRSWPHRPLVFRIASIAIVLLLTVNCVFNYNFRFRKPLGTEYAEARAAFDDGYVPASNSFTFQAPAESYFTQRYGIVRSWDEFGVPSLFFKWVPEWYFKQLLFEKTGDRQRAAALQVRVIR